MQMYSLLETDSSPSLQDIEDGFDGMLTSFHTQKISHQYMQEIFVDALDIDRYSLP